MKYCTKCERAYNAEYKRCPWHTGDMRNAFNRTFFKPVTDKKQVRVVAQSKGKGVNYTAILNESGDYLRVETDKGSRYWVTKSSVRML